MSDNMKIWDQIAKTDPAHTKDFTRAGGFKGTAIRPMYAIQKMTEVFGVCGKGWGYMEPQYQIVDGTEGQKLVYCTLCLWHGNHGQFVYGVGGDFIIVKQRDGLRSDDEAFKKAFTDALMNAMKHLGMSADVHMNQFDANKYVQEAKAAEKGMQGRMADNPDIQQDMKDLGYDAKKIYTTVIEELDQCQDTEMLNIWVKTNKVSGRMKGMPSKYADDVKNRYNTLKQHFADKGI